LKELNPLADRIDMLAETVSSFLLRGYSKEEIKRAEEFFNQRMSEKLTRQQFLEILDRPFKEGGLGLWNWQKVSSRMLFFWI